MFFTVLIFIMFSVAALIVSLIAWRQKSKPLYITGWILVGIMILMTIANFRVIRLIFIYNDFQSLLILAVILFLPAIFLIKYSSDKPIDSSLDGGTAGGAITEEYLDEIINSPEEDIDYEEDLDLR
jgi:energy-coupling factor transporter transmembrane protein EcfT